jgi:hypothetical protein
VTLRQAVIAEIEARMRWGIYKREDQNTLLALLKSDDGGPVHSQTAAPRQRQLAAPPPGAERRPYLDRSSIDHGVVAAS